MEKTREEQLDEAIRELFESHFYSTRLEWGHQDGRGLLDLNTPLFAKFVTLLPGMLEKMK